jgi:hypothetical protein
MHSLQFVPIVYTLLLPEPKLRVDFYKGGLLLRSFRWLSEVVKKAGCIFTSISLVSAMFFAVPDAYIIYVICNLLITLESRYVGF